MSTETAGAMEQRAVGSTGIRLSVIGFGTAQLQMLPRRQAVQTLLRGFELGVNWVHSAPDYGGVESWIAEAIDRSGRDVMVLATGPGQLDLFEPFFENTCTWFRRRSLALYGLNCIDDIERMGERVWGPGGMIEFLQRKKAEGRLSGIFCSTHGPADYVAKLVRSGVFDAVMLAFNPLGFHLLSYYADPEGRRFENIAENRAQIFPLARDHGVSLLVMKPLAGGLLSRGKAFPPHTWMAGPHEPPPPADLLRYILQQPGVCAVVPGVASVEEADEDARAGHTRLPLSSGAAAAVEQQAAAMRTSLCSRCGQCESTCSMGLRISSMFRDAYIWNYGNETFMADDRENYFRLHPSAVAVCSTCINRTCQCPEGIDIPDAMQTIHGTVRSLRTAARHPGHLDCGASCPPGGPYRLSVLTSELPRVLPPDGLAVGRFLVENTGDAMWTAFSHIPDAAIATAIGVTVGGTLVERIPIRQNVSPRQRSHLVFEVRAPARPGEYEVDVSLLPLKGRRTGANATTFFSTRINVGDLRMRSAAPPPRGLYRRARSTASRARRRVKRWLGYQVPGPDSGYRVRYLEHTVPETVHAGETYGIRLGVQNTGSRQWRSSTLTPHPVEIVVFVDGIVRNVIGLPADTVGPGETATVHFALRLCDPGPHEIKIDLAAKNIAWFADCGAAPLALTVDAQEVPATTTGLAMDAALKHNPWHYLPTQGIAHARDGRPFPLFISRAQGCRLWDPEGHEYIDYTMGWGSTILGHADPRVQRAIGDVLDSGPLTPFPHPLEMEVSQMVVEDVPSAEMVVFGKNGSDVCTIAARLARLTTGRHVILSCGFHGWQDFALDYFSCADSGIPEHRERVLHKFRFNDREDFFRLYERHKRDLAAVMIEPAGPFASEDEGPGGDADPEFLAEIAAAARRAGALVIFDEIITGYRYPGGTVQRATGVLPDLTCLGKALASGMPLSALTGPRRIFHDALVRTHYCPTFKAEIYSLAAARAAIRIYRQEPVAAHIRTYGEQLREAIREIAAEVGIGVECRGPAFRMAVLFQDGDPRRRRMKRTLYVQELLKEGIVTVSGVMLPSLAHDAAVLERTRAGVRQALSVVAEADRGHGLEERIEIPLL